MINKKLEELQIKYRKGTEADLDFLSGAIIQAERSGTSYSMYEKVFGLDESLLKQLLIQILQEDLENCELSYSTFTIAETNNVPVACIASWIEGTGNRASSSIKAFLFARFLGIEKWKTCDEKLKALSIIDIPRTPGALQIEAVYTSEICRGKGIVKKIIDHIIEHSSLENGSTVQILSVIGNENSFRAFTKAGFNAVQTKPLLNKELNQYFPGNGRILWEKKITKN